MFDESGRDGRKGEEERGRGLSLVTEVAISVVKSNREEGEKEEEERTRGEEDIYIYIYKTDRSLLGSRRSMRRREESRTKRNRIETVLDTIRPFPIPRFSGNERHESSVFFSSSSSSPHHHAR